MSLIEPVLESAATDKTAQTYGRLHELLGEGPLPEPWLLYGRVPAFLQDFYMNFKKFVYQEGALDAATKNTIALAVSAILKCQPWRDYFAQRSASFGQDPQYVADTLAVASTCAMYNVFFKFRDLSGSAMFEGMAVGLRAHTFAGTSLTPQMVELINIAISDLNGCKPCTSGHVEKARQLGLSDEAILECVQCTATMAAGCALLNTAG